VGKGAWHAANNDAQAYRAVPTIGRGGHGAIGIPLNCLAVPGAFAHPTHLRTPVFSSSDALPSPSRRR